MKAYVLLEDSDQMLRSVPEPIGIAVTTEAEAEKWKKSDPSCRAYQAVEIFDNLEDGLKRSSRTLGAQIDKPKHGIDHCKVDIGDKPLSL